MHHTGVVDPHNLVELALAVVELALAAVELALAVVELALAVLELALALVDLALAPEEMVNVVVLVPPTDSHSLHTEKTSAIAITVSKKHYKQISILDGIFRSIQYML